MEQKPHKKDELTLANNVLKLAEALLKVIVTILFRLTKLLAPLAYLFVRYYEPSFMLSLSFSYTITTISIYPLSLLSLPQNHTLYLSISSFSSLSLSLSVIALSL